MPRILFMGTPQFAATILAALCTQFDICAVYTREDKPSGRGKQLAESPVKIVARERGLPVEQPRTLRGEPVQTRLRDYRPDLIVVAAFGLILPQIVLDIPPLGCINTHASLLPRWRGASPVTAAILAGDDETGITLMRMDAGVDTGPIIATRRLPIGADDTTGTLSDKLSELAAHLLLETLPSWSEGKIEPVPQTGEASFSSLVRKEHGLIDWSRTAIEIERAVRAYNPWPSAYTYWRPSRRAERAPAESLLLKIWRAVVTDSETDRVPGNVEEKKGRIGVSSGAGTLVLKEVQLAGKRPMTIEEFVRGQPGFVGTKLGRP